MELSVCDKPIGFLLNLTVQLRTKSKHTENWVFTDNFGFRSVLHRFCKVFVPLLPSSLASCESHLVAEKSTRHLSRIMIEESSPIYYSVTKEQRPYQTNYFFKKPLF